MFGPLCLRPVLPLLPSAWSTAASCAAALCSSSPACACAAAAFRFVLPPALRSLTSPQCSSPSRIAFSCERRRLRAQELWMDDTDGRSASCSQKESNQTWPHHAAPRGFGPGCRRHYASDVHARQFRARGDLGPPFPHRRCCCHTARTALRRSTCRCTLFSPPSVRAATLSSAAASEETQDQPGSDLRCSRCGTWWSSCGTSSALTRTISRTTPRCWSCFRWPPSPVLFVVPSGLVVAHAARASFVHDCVCSLITDRKSVV